jgi:putative sigma-54 modulation protein
MLQRRIREPLQRTASENRFREAPSEEPHRTPEAAPEKLHPRASLGLEGRSRRLLSTCSIERSVSDSQRIANLPIMISYDVGIELRPTCLSRSMRRSHRSMPRAQEPWAGVRTGGRRSDCAPAFGLIARNGESIAELGCLPSMHVDIRWKGLPKSPSLADHVQNRLRSALRGFQEKVRTVTVRFEDTNGPRGGIDKRCSVEMTGAFGILVAEGRDGDFYAAADQALSRAERSVAKSLKRDRPSRERLAERAPALRPQ